MAVLLQVRNACKSYGEQVLLDDAGCTLTDDVKVGFVGRNGAGKSTLLRILLGEEELDSGEISRHPNLRLGYLRQHDPFLPGESALEFLMRDSEQPDWKCGEVAGEFELKGTYLEGPVSKLSGGWQTRVKLAALLLHEPNLLLLDEPTNFLDLRTQILLEHFLQNHSGACLIVSHDRAFLSATCSHTLDLSAGISRRTRGRSRPTCSSNARSGNTTSAPMPPFSRSAGNLKISSRAIRPGPARPHGLNQRANSSSGWN